MAERLPRADQRDRQGLNPRADRRIGDLHARIVRGGANVDEGGVLEATLRTAARIVVRAPQGGLRAPRLEQPQLRVRMELPPDRDQVSLDVGYELHHVAKPFHDQGAQTLRRNAGLENEDFIVHGTDRASRGIRWSRNLSWPLAAGPPSRPRSRAQPP